MRKILFFILLIGTATLGGCDQKSERLKAVLAYSGENRRELEKVLKHYSDNLSDSIKLKAAIFLIENMPGHYTYGGDYMQKYIAKVDTVKNIPYYFKKFIQTIPFQYPQFKDRLILQEDVKFIKAEFLIHNIESAFRQWQTYPWLKDLDFDTFKEYLLPYRTDNEPLDNWRDSIETLQKDLQDYSKYYDDCRYSIYSMRNEFNFFVNIENKIPEAELADFKSDCISTSKGDLIALRTIGIPSAIDFIPHFSNRNGRHYWATPIDQQKKIYKSYQTETWTVAKIFRKTFSHNKRAIPSSREYIPPFFQDPFNKDVTDLYLTTADVTLKIPRKTKARHAYLAVFNDLTWKSIACRELSGNKVTFEKMGKDILYLPVYYNEEEEMVPLAPPFILKNTGQIKTLKNRKDSLQTLKLVRKYPYLSTTAYWVETLKNTRLERADNIDFKNADTVFRITEKPNYQYITIHTDSVKKRFWRLGNEQCPRVSLAEFRFTDRQGQEIHGKIIGPDTINSKHLYDDNWLTMKGGNKWISLDFRKPVAISEIRILPHNDANGIVPGNEYELFYYDFPEGWISLGQQTATGYDIEYNNAPTNGLYWLRNLTTGKEERIFTWEKGRARFW